MPFIIQDTTVHLQTEPFSYQGHTFVALREVAEALGGTVVLDLAANQATVTITPWEAKVTAGSAEVTVDGHGQSVTADIAGPPYIEHEAMYVPFDFFRDVFGYEVLLEGTTVTIVNPNAA